MNIEHLQTIFPTLIFKPNEALAPFTYMKVGGPARVFVEVGTKDDLSALIRFCFQEKIEFVVIGGASNTIIPDSGLDKLVIRNMTNSITFTQADNNVVEVTADSGVITAVLANKTMDQGLTGLEYFIGVPGTIGGAVVNNSHFTARDLIGHLVKHVEVCTPEGRVETWERSKLDFDYDHSIFHHTLDVILSSTFVLHKDSQEHIRERVKQAALKRTSTQPIGIPSSGCMYRNPQITQEHLNVIQSHTEVPAGAYHVREDGKIQIAAGFLIDRAGLKGTKVGGAQVSEKHATYMLNTGDATAHDLELLCEKVEQTVKDKWGVNLEREVFFIQ
jgi:UDP-N-acetylmuramate dehydrogenase